MLNYGGQVNRKCLCERLMVSPGTSIHKKQGSHSTAWICLRGEMLSNVCGCRICIYITIIKHFKILFKVSHYITIGTRDKIGLLSK